MYHHNNNNQYYGPPPAQNFNYNRNSYSNQNYCVPPPSYPQFNNSNFYSRPQFQPNQQYQQPSTSNSWKKNNKRSHEFVSPSSNSGSPERKRQFQKRYGHQESVHQRPIDHHQQQQQPNKFRNNFPHAAFQTQQAIHNTPPQQNPQQFINKQSQGGQWKKVKQEHPVVKVQEDRKKDWAEKMSITLNLLRGCNAGEEAQILLLNLQPPRTVWFKTKEDIHNDLIKFLTPLGVEKVLIFGSSLTGLDFHGSDLDFYVQLKSHPVTEEETKVVISKTAKLTRLLKGSDFMIICTIQGARVPLIRLLHRRSKVSCDVNFTSKFGYYNSYFLGHVVSFDKRIKEFAVILKIWGKSCKLPTNMIITNYCLMMLMIFYLQNLQEPMLDNILDNQRNRSPMVLDEKKKWNFYFNDDINRAHNNHQSLRELLTGFFEYYSKINPREEVISLLLGRLIKRTEFDTHPDLEECRRLITSCGLPQFKADSADLFYVQDAFELNLNIGIKSKKSVDSFFEVINLSHQKCQELSDRPFSELLIKLFTDVQLPVVQPNAKNSEGGKKKNKAKNKFEMIIHAIPGDLKQCQDILTHQNSSRLYTAEDQQKFFYDHAIEFTQKFLQDIYLCTIIPEVSESSSNETRFKVILPIDTINLRKKISFKDEAAVNNEMKLSLKIAGNNVKFDLDVLMIISTKDGGKSVQFEMIDESKAGKSALQNFGSYFSVNIFNALRYFLKKRLENIVIDT